MLYGKYSRKDVHRILNWDENPIAQNVGGYMIDPKTKTCPIFVNYHKEDDISAANSSGIFNTILVRSGHKIDESRSKAKYFLDSIHESISVVSD